MGHRKIIHIDMDCFYAAIECRDDPSVANKPVGVGGESGRGVLTTCNYIAREFGCRSAMPVFKARELCPDLIIKPVRFSVYRTESKKIRQIFRDFTSLIEPLSLDEAYLDVSHRKEYAWSLARKIRKMIWAETGLTASAGIAPNKMLAKIASDWNKPSGQFAILPKEIETFMEKLPVRKIPGIGSKTEEILKSNNILTCGELQKVDKLVLAGWLGSKFSEEIWNRCRGIDNREVEVLRVRKSMSVERTFEKNLETEEECLPYLESLLKELNEDFLKMQNPKPFSKIFVKVKFANFQKTSREIVSSHLELRLIRDLFGEAFGRSPHAVRLIGLGVRFKNKAEDKKQMEFFF